MNRNVPLFGFIIGLLLPILGYAIVFFFWNHGTSFGGFWNTIRHDADILAKILTMSLLVNLVPFLYYNYKRLDLTVRGIVIATVLYAVLIVLIKYVWK